LLPGSVSFLGNTRPAGSRGWDAPRRWDSAIRRLLIIGAMTVVR
jgi:transposase